MATIQIKSTFSVCPEGVHIFRIYDVVYDKEFGKLLVKMVNAQGSTHTERFFLMTNSGEMNDKACGAFAYFAKTAMRDSTLEEIDHTDLIGRYIKAEVVHTVQPSRNDPTKNVTFANLGDKWEADGFDTQPVEKALTLGTTQKTPAASPNPQPTGLDLNAILHNKG